MGETTGRWILAGLPMVRIDKLFPVSHQAVDKVRQWRSRIVQVLNVHQRVRLRSSLVAALLDSLSEQPAKNLDSVCRCSWLQSEHVVRQQPASPSRLSG